LLAHTKGFNLAVKRILLIEDHAAFRQSLALLIDLRPGLQVTAQAASIAEGISKASEGFDVAVVDLSMPDGDGADLVGRLREIAPRAGVIGLSRRRRRERYARALGAGADGVVSKDATIEEILGVLEVLCIDDISILKWEE
jgi:DNA-binding NarL/FixJ family response regulator